MYRSLSTCNQVLTEMNKKIKKGFTLIEMAVAIGLLAMVIVFAMVVFRVSIDAYRTTIANTEIMQKLRAITDQLNSDFGGLQREATVFGFEISGSDPNWVRVDKIGFFANGDFQSTGQYGSASKTVVGNIAYIFYGQSSFPDPCSLKLDEKRKKVLARRQTILTSNDDFEDDSNELGECYYGSLAEWKVDPPFSSDPNEWVQRPRVDIDDPNDLVMYMAKGVDDFTIQLEDDMDANNAIVWWPTNPEVEDGITEGEYTGQLRAIKFTFTLYDSKGIIKNGRTFTHIVYIGD